MEGIGGICVFDKVGDLLLAGNRFVTIWAVEKGDLPPDFHVLLGTPHLLELGVSLDFALHHPGCPLRETMVTREFSPAALPDPLLFCPLAWCRSAWTLWTLSLVSLTLIMAPRSSDPLSDPAVSRVASIVLEPHFLVVIVAFMCLAWFLWVLPELAGLSL